MRAKRIRYLEALFAALGLAGKVRRGGAMHALLAETEGD